MNETYFSIDRTGFPMVYSNAINAYVSWLPTTKIQFEYFLCSQPDSRFDSTWYEKILAMNERVSPRDISAANYWNAFITGVKPSEALSYCAWCGDDFALPTLAEWNLVFAEFRDADPVPSTDVPGNDLPGPRAQTLVEQLSAASGKSAADVGYTPSMADSMLLRSGVMEWVEYKEEGLSWGGKGEPSPKFHGSLVSAADRQPSLPHNPEGDRLYYYGFRTIKRTDR